MALEILVYDLDSESRKLPTGCVYTRTGAAWVVEAGRLRQLAPNEPMWGPRGLIVEDAATNLLALSQPSSGSEWSQAGLFDFPQAVSMLAAGTALAHAAKGTSDSPVREIDDPLPDNAVALGTVWALVECLDNVYVDIGTRDGAQNWVDRARWAQPHGVAYPLPSDRTDMLALGRLRPEIGPNKGRLIELACVSPTGLDGRKLGIAPTGDHQNHLRAVLHHVQVEAGPGPTSPIVTTSGAGTRDRATAIAAVLSVGAQQTSLQIFGQAPVWMGKRQVVWQMDSDTDADAQRVALERTAAGQLQLVCGGAALDLGKLANGESFGVAFKVSSGTMRASRDGLTVVSVAASLPAATKERWGHGYAAGAAFSGEIIRQRRWLSVATDEELRALSADTLALPGDQSTLVPAPLFAAEFDKARAPASLLENAVVPSSGNARLLKVYAGSGRYVYRKARSSDSKQELSWSGTRRVENLLAATDLHQSSGVVAPGTNVTAIGTATHLGLPCDYITWPAATHAWGTSLCRMTPAVSVLSLGAVITGRMNIAVSRDMTSGEMLQVWMTGDASTARRYVSGLKAGRFYSIAINNVPTESVAVGASAIYVAVWDGVVLTSPLTLYCRAKQIVDSTGLAESEMVQPFVDPGVDYGFGCKGVRHFHTACANTVDATTGEIIEAEGALISPAPGISWQPAATSILPGNMVDTAIIPATIVDGSGVSPWGLTPKKVVSHASSAAHAATLGASGTVGNGAKVTHKYCIKAAGFSWAWVGDGAGAAWHRAWVNLATGALGTLAGLTAASVKPLGDGWFEVALTHTGDGSNGGAQTYYVGCANADGAVTISGNGSDGVLCGGISAAIGDNIGTPVLGNGTSRVPDQPLAQLPAVGTGPFTAIMDITLNTGLWAGYGWIPFSINGSSGCFLYMISSGFYFYKDGATLVNVPGVTLTENQRIKIAFRRKSNGDIAVFTDGVLRVEVASSNYDGAAQPIFGAASYLPDAIYHSQQLFHLALSEAECIGRTA